MISSLNHQFVRFGLVGLLNTAVDIGLYLILISATGSIIFSSMISTSAALCISLLLNKRFTFRLTSLSIQRTLLFVVVTLIGLWAAQPIIIFAGQNILENINLTSSGIDLKVLLPKTAAIAFTVFWNYFFYKNLVFRKQFS